MTSTDLVPEGDLSTSLPRPPWHTMTTDDALAHWRSAMNGSRRKRPRDGSKDTAPTKSSVLREKAVGHCSGAAILAFFTGKTVDALVVVCVVVANTLIGFVQDMRASHALEALTRLVSELCVVVRDSERITVPVATWYQRGRKYRRRAVVVPIISLKSGYAALQGGNTASRYDITTRTGISVEIS